MITQKYMQGQHEIKIEIAESIDDASKHGFSPGQYNRFFVDGKSTENYQAVMRFIIEETRKNRSSLVPNDQDLIKMRNQMITDQNEMAREQIESLKKMYAGYGIPQDMLDDMDKFIPTINESGIRVKE